MRHDVRKVEIGHDTPPEERLWCLRAAVLLLGAYLVGVVAATLRFDATVWHRNALIWCATLGCLTLVAACAVSWIPVRWIRRGTLLALVLSLIVNMTVMITLSYVHFVPPVAQADADRDETVEEPPSEKVPEFYEFAVDGQDRPRRAYEKPVETGEPDAEFVEDVHKTTVAGHSVEPPPNDLPSDLTAHRLPLPQRRQQVVESAPRRATDEGTLSRLAPAREPRAARPLVTSSQVPQHVVIEQLNAAPTEVQRQVELVVENAMTEQSVPESEREANQRQFVRRDSPAETGQPAAANPSLPQRDDQQERLSRAMEQVARVPTIARKTAADSLDPAPLGTLARTATSPELPQRAQQEPLDVTAETPRRVTQREQPGPTQPTLQLVEEPVERRETAANIDVPIEVAEHSSSAVADAPEQVDSRDLAVQRETSRLADDQRPMANVQPSDQAVELTVAAPQRATESSQVPATVADEIADPRERVAATVERVAMVPVSPSTVTTEEASPSQVSTVNPEALPARMALTKASQGTAGAGASNNFERGANSPPSPVAVASASARRSEASQQERAGPALSPIPGAKIPRRTSGANTPTATVASPSSIGAERMRAEQIAATEVSAAAGGQPQQASAPTAPVTAQPGQSDVDLGPTRVASNDGVRQQAGGGQPEVMDALPDATQVRKPWGGAVTSQLRNAQEGYTVAAPPVATGGTVATVGDLDQRPVTVSRQSVASTKANHEIEAASPSDPVSVTQRPPALTRAFVPSAASTEQRLGGGTSADQVRLPRRAAVPAATSDLHVAQVGAQISDGVPDSAPTAAEGIQKQDRATGVPSLVARETAMGASGELVVDRSARLIEGGQGELQRASFDAVVTTAIPDPAGRGARADFGTRTQLPLAVRAETTVEAPISGTASPDAPTQPRADVSLSARSGDVTRHDAGGLDVPVEALEGEGGIGFTPARDVGMVRRTAQSASRFVADSRARFLRQDVGAPVSLDTQVVIPTEAFMSRINRRGQEIAGGDGKPSRKTEEAIELGLVYLAQQQANDGRWSFQNAGNAPGLPPESALIQSDTAATGLALLSFLGAGYHHQSDTYQQPVRHGLTFLLANQQPNGDLYIAQDELSNGSAWLYSHAIASIALCEAYGMTQDPQLRDAAQRAIDFIVLAQHQSRGGWRYAPGVGSDTSVSGWMVMALRSAELANLDVPTSVWARVDRWLDAAQDSDKRPQLYRYNPMAPNTLEQGHGRQSSKTMTSVGLLMRLYTGWRRDHPAMIDGGDYLRQHLPEVGGLRNPERDTYYWYYATQVMFHMRGDYWETWNRYLHPLLTDSQVKEGPLAGSWDPFRPLPDRWAQHGGRLYVTTLNLLSLEVYYRHLPIYADTAK